MAFYASIWFLIESTLISDGFRKWFYLSFYIHPIFLIACWIFLFLNTLLDCVLSFILLPLLRIALFLVSHLSHLYGSAKCAVFYCFWSNRVSDCQNDSQESERHRILETAHESAQDFQSFSISFAASAVTCEVEAEFIPGKYEDVEEEQIYFEDAVEELEVGPSVVVDASLDDLNVDNIEYMPTLSSPEVGVNLNEHVSSFLMVNLATEEGFFMEECPVPNPVFSSFSLPPLASEPVGSAIFAETSDEDIHVNQYAPHVPPLSMLREVGDIHGSIEPDPFYMVYVERMGWFDILNYERTCGISMFPHHHIA